MKERDKSFVSNTSHDLQQIVLSLKTVSYCSGCDIQKAALWNSALSVQISMKKGSLKHNFFVNKSSIYPEKTQKDWRLSYHSKYIFGLQ